MVRTPVVARTAVQHIVHRVKFIDDTVAVVVDAVIAPLHPVVRQRARILAARCHRINVVKPGFADILADPQQTSGGPHVRRRVRRATVIAATAVVHVLLQVVTLVDGTVAVVVQSVAHFQGRAHLPNALFPAPRAHGETRCALSLAGECPVSVGNASCPGVAGPAHITVIHRTTAVVVNPVTGIIHGSGNPAVASSRRGWVRLGESLVAFGQDAFPVHTGTGAVCEGADASAFAAVQGIRHESSLAAFFHGNPRVIDDSVAVVVHSVTEFHASPRNGT